MSILTQKLLFDDFTIPLAPEVSAAIESMAAGGGAESRGAIFTRSEVVNFILELSGYTEDRPL
jgi:hypothetical protein